MPKLEELIAQRADIDKQIEELKSITGKRWRADEDEYYYRVDNEGDVSDMLEYGGVINNYLYSIGNYHQTEAQAIAYRERLIATQQIIDRIAELNAEQGWVVDWEDAMQTKFNISYCHFKKRINLEEWRYIQNSQSEFYGSEKTIKTVIEEMQPQLKLWLGVE